MTASLGKFNDIGARLAWKHSVLRYDARGGARHLYAGPITVWNRPSIKFDGEHSMHCLRYGQDPRGR